MSFTQKQITDKQKWYIVTNKYEEDTVVPFDVVGANPDILDFADYIESGTPKSFYVCEGFGARLSAPGYLDCTEWTVFDTVEEAEEYLDEMYGNDDTSNAGCDACGMEDRIEGSNFCADCLPDQK